MKLVRIVFSPTGSTEKVTDLLSKEIGGDPVTIDLMGNSFEQYASIEPEDICIIAVPSFGGRVPVPAVDRLKKISGNKARTVLVVTYGNRAYDDTLVELKDIADERGFDCIAAVAAVTEHSMMHQYGAGRPDQSDEAELRTYGKQIRELIEGGKRNFQLKVPGNRPYVKMGSVPLHPAATSACTKCGTCTYVCPAGAISLEHPEKTDGKKCITCMGCVAVCPQHARRLNPIVLKIAGMSMKKVCGGRKENQCILG